MKVTSTDWRKNFMLSPMIFLNGEELRDVFEADDDVGYVIRAKRTGGKLSHTNGTIDTERLDGEVKIVGVLRASEENAA